MKQQGSIINNSIFNVIKTFSNIVFPVITFVYSARILGVDGVGKVTFSKSIITYFTMFAMLGMNYYGTREVARRRDDRILLSRYVHEMLGINLCTTLVAYLFLFICAVYVSKLYDYQELLLVMSPAVLLQGMGMEWLYQGIEEYRYIALRSVVFQGIAIAAMLIFVKRPEDVVAYAVITMIASSGSYVLNFINARKYISFSFLGQYHIRQHLRPLLWLFAMALSIELYTVLDSTMLGFLQGDAAVGRYTAAVKVNKMMNTLITAAGSVLIPRFSYYIYQQNSEKIQVLVKAIYNYVFMLSIPIAVGLFMLSDEIILLLSGKGFVSAGLTMRILTPIVLLIPFSVATNQQIFVPMGKEKLILQATVMGAVTNFTFNLLLIPRFAENGAAVATVLAEFAVMAVCFWNIGKFYDRKQIFRQYFQYWIAAAPIMVIVILAKLFSVRYIVRMCIAIPLSAVFYFVILRVWKNPYLIYGMERLKKCRSIQKGEGR